MNKLMKNKRIIIPSFISIIIIIVIILSIKMDFSKLMGNSVYNQIIISEREKYTLKDDYVSTCTSTDSNIVKTQLIGGKCVINGIKMGTTSVDLFIANSGITYKTYNIVVNDYVKIRKKSKFSSKNVSFNIVTSDMEHIDFKYCYVKNGFCNQLVLNDDMINNKEIRLNNIDRDVKQVCLYAYDDKLIDFLCVDRGWLNIFW